MSFEYTGERAEEFRDAALECSNAVIETFEMAAKTMREELEDGPEHAVCVIVKMNLVMGAMEQLMGELEAKLTSINADTYQKFTEEVTLGCKITQIQVMIRAAGMDLADILGNDVEKASGYTPPGYL